MLKGNVGHSTNTAREPRIPSSSEGSDIRDNSRSVGSLMAHRRVACRGFLFSRLPRPDDGFQGRPAAVLRRQPAPLASADTAVCCTRLPVLLAFQQKI